MKLSTMPGFSENTIILRSENGPEKMAIHDFVVKNPGLHLVCRPANDDANALEVIFEIKARDQVQHYN